jgi:SHS2 domain-containing protein
VKRRVTNDHAVTAVSGGETFKETGQWQAGDRGGSYHLFDHGADIGILFSGEDLEDLLRNGARALMSLIVERGGAGREVTKTISLEAGEDLPVRFLNELLYLFDVERFMIEDLTLTKESSGVRLILRGTAFEQGRDRVKREVKAATYHGFTAQREGALLNVRVVLDI